MKFIYSDARNSSMSEVVEQVKFDGLFSFSFSAAQKRKHFKYFWILPRISRDSEKCLQMFIEFRTIFLIFQIIFELR